MAEVSHCQSSPIFPFDNVDDPGLWWDCFDRCVFEHLEKYVVGYRGVAGCSVGQFISFTIFILLDVLYYEFFEIILHFFMRPKYLSRVGSLAMHSFSICTATTLESVWRMHF
jgi:hypothetical protein